MTNAFQEAIDCNDGDQAARIIHDALDIESHNAATCCFPKTRPSIASIGDRL
jgi:hypothetical protein